MAGWTVVPNQNTSAWKPVKETQETTPPPPPPSIPRSPWQRYKDNFSAGQDAIDKAAETEPFTGPGSRPGIGGAIHTFANNLGAGATQLLTPLVHPLDTAAGIVKTANAALSGDPMQISEAGQSMVRPFMEKPGASAVAAIPQVAMVLAGGGEVANAKPSGIPRVGTYRSPVVPAIETQAEKLAKAILPPEGVTPNLVRSITKEAPRVREYAARTGNPLKTVPEGMKAAEGVASEGLAHYRSNFLEPNANVHVPLESGISPELGHSTTVGQIEKRISDINDLTRGSTASAKSTGAEMTAQERLGLENEGKALRQKLYQTLSERTGVSPEEIQGMREGYGGQFALKNALEGGHYNRLTRVGLQSQGAGSGIYPSKAGIVDKLITSLRGGPERIANRQFSKQISAFDPQAPNYPTPNPPTPPGFEMPNVSQDMLRRIEAVGTDEGVEGAPPPIAKPLNGPMRKASSVLENERISRAMENESNAAFHQKRAANTATAGKRLQGGR